jgi:hypothetical protein
MAFFEAAYSMAGLHIGRVWQRRFAVSAETASRRANEGSRDREEQTLLQLAIIPG